jgi:hypothetical protein
MNRFPTLCQASASLPVCTQQYLQKVKLVPHAPDVNFISAERLNTSTALSSSLIINDLDLVALRLDSAIVMACDLEIDILSQDDLQRHVAA